MLVIHQGRDGHREEGVRELEHDRFRDGDRRHGKKVKNPAEGRGHRPIQKQAFVPGADRDRAGETQQFHDREHHDEPHRDHGAHGDLVRSHLHEERGQREEERRGRDHRRSGETVVRKRTHRSPRSRMRMISCSMYFRLMNTRQGFFVHAATISPPPEHWPVSTSRRSRTTAIQRPENSPGASAR